MARLSVYYKPIITHLVEGDGSKTLCGVDVSDWVYGGEVDDGRAMCGCIRCQRIADKRAAKQERTNDR